MLICNELKKTFRPEFINRIDDIIVFTRLSRENIREIAAKLLRDVAERTKDLGIELEFTASVADKVASAGFDEVYGARPLKRAVRSLIEDTLSEMLLDGRIKAGQKYVCDTENGEIVFR